MIKPFMAFASLLLVMLFAIGIHITLFFPYEKNTKLIQNMTSLTHRAALSLSITYDESSYNSTYPEMSTLGRMDFIYDK